MIQLDGFAIFCCLAVFIAITVGIWCLQKKASDRRWQAELDRRIDVEVKRARKEAKDDAETFRVSSVSLANRAALPACSEGLDQLAKRCRVIIAALNFGHKPSQLLLLHALDSDCAAFMEIARVTLAQLPLRARSGVGSSLRALWAETMEAISSEFLSRTDLALPHSFFTLNGVMQSQQSLMALGDSAAPGVGSPATK